MTLKKPKNAKGLVGINPFDECKAIAQTMYWGNPEGDPSKVKPSKWQGVVVIGCVLMQKPELDGELFLRTGGSWTINDQSPEVARALAEQLRETADALEREAGS